MSYLFIKEEKIVMKGKICLIYDVKICTETCAFSHKCKSLENQSACTIFFHEAKINELTFNRVMVKNIFAVYNMKLTGKKIR